MLLDEETPRREKIKRKAKRSKIECSFGKILEPKKKVDRMDPVTRKLINEVKGIKNNIVKVHDDLAEYYLNAKIP